jgi:hypothetical protein
MGIVWKARRKEVACGRRRSERAAQANEPKRSAQWGEEKCIEGFNEKVRRKKTSKKTQT